MHTANGINVHSAPHLTSIGDHQHTGHELDFMRKNSFSTDYKMIAKQFLITGIIWAILGGLFSVVFRL